MSTCTNFLEKQKTAFKKGKKVENYFAFLMMKSGKFTKQLEAKGKQDTYEHWDVGFITKKGEKIEVTTLINAIVMRLRHYNL
jgi:hypothetical protein